VVGCGAGSCANSGAGCRGGAYAGGGGHSGFTGTGLACSPLGRRLSVMAQSLAPDHESELSVC
ncbi:hypothetical protein B7767_15455, partial [Streptomyces sp. 13-12-16]